MSNTELPLYFPSGLSIRRARDLAKDERKNGRYSTLSAAQDAIAQNEMGRSWAKSIDYLRGRQHFMTIDDIKSVMRDVPELTYFGFGSSWHREKTYEEYLQDVELDKQKLLASLNECNRACQYLQYVEKRKTVNRNINSYGLKHSVEHYFHKHYPGRSHSLCYVSNGAFLCAAYFMGFDVKRKPGSPNAWINYSQKSPVFLWREYCSKSYPDIKEVKRLDQLEQMLDLPKSEQVKEYHRYMSRQLETIHQT